MAKIRYGIIGLGPRGFALIDSAKKTGEVEIVAGADLDSASREELRKIVPNAKLYADYKALLKLDEVDAVVIATPNFTHKGIAIDAIKANKDIFCEKPIGITMQEFNEVAEELEKTDLIFQTGIELRFSKMGTKLKQAVDNRDIGNLQMLWCREFRPPFKCGAEGWRVSKKSGGTFLEKCIHHFDLFCWLAKSKPKMVSAIGGGDVIYKDNGIVDNGIVSIEFENGIRACLTLALFHDVGFLMELGALGDNGRIETNTPPGRMSVFNNQYTATYDFVKTEIAGDFDHEGEVEQHLSFINSVRSRKPSLAGIEAVRYAHMICIAAEKSIEQKNPIYL